MQGVQAWDRPAILIEPFDERTPTLHDPLFQFCCNDASIAMKVLTTQSYLLDSCLLDTDNNSPQSSYSTHSTYSSY